MISPKGGQNDPPQKKKKLSELFTYKLDLFSDICICFLHEIKGYKSSLEKIALINAENVCTCNRQIIQYTVWSVNDGLSGNLRKPAAEISGRFPAGFRIFY